MLFCATGAQAVPDAGLAAGQSRLVLTPHIDFLAEPEAGASLQQMLQRDDWQPLPSNTAIHNAGFDTHPYWYRMRLKIGSDIQPGTVRYLEIAYPLLDYVDLYIHTGTGSFEHYSSGDQRPFSQRAIQHRNIVFPIRLQPGVTTSLYLRVATESTHTLPITLWSDGAFIDKSNKELAALGIYYGVMFIMILYNAFLWVSVRERSYLSYIAFIFCGGILMPGAINGLGAEYVWGFMPRWTNLSVLITTGLAISTGLLFTQQTLRARKHDPLFYWILNLGIFAGLAEMLVATVVEYAVGIRIAMILGVAAAVIVASYSVRSMLRGQQEALFFVLGWAAFLTGIVLKVLQGHGLLPTNFLTQYSMQIGMIMQVTLLSLALANRINTERSAKLAAQGEVLSAREEAISSLNRYQQIVENVPEGIFQVDEKGHLVSANPAMVGQFGYDSEAEFLAAAGDFRLELFVDAEDVRKIDLELQGSGQVQGFETRMFRKDGSSFWAALTMHAEHDEDKNLVKIDGMLTDIDERRERERQSRQQQQQEAEAAAKNQFLARLSHEVRTPMNAITGFVDLALRSHSDHKRVDYLGQIRMASHSLLAIINDILDFSKIENGKMQLEARPFRLQAIFDKLSDMFARAAADKGVELIISAHADIPGMLVGDPLRLEQVLVNMLSNAIKFTEEGEVEVQAELVSQNGMQAELKITVRDTGVGMDEDQQSQLFQVLHNVDESITRKYEGSGLGLSISRQLIEMMGGTIGLFSEPGKGSRFWIHLPLSVTEEQHSSGQYVLPQELCGRRVLIVDDNATARRVYASQLEQMGLLVEIAENGIEALACVETADIALVLMDADMPRPDGVEAARHIRELPQGSVLPMLMMVPYGREERIAQMPDLQVQASLVKPIKPANLFAAVHEALRGWAGDSFASLPDRSSLPDANILDGRNLLLAEDNPLNQDLACELLSSLGMRVQVAQNGWEAVEAVRRCDYDAVLMDVEMPVMDGYQATHQIRNELNKADQVIIGMSANTAARDRALGLEAGMNAYITKPIDLEELVYVLQIHIGRDAEALPQNDVEEFLDGVQQRSSQQGARD